jgi:hypothetical protein
MAIAFFMNRSSMAARDKSCALTPSLPRLRPLSFGRRDPSPPTPSPELAPSAVLCGTL